MTKYTVHKGVDVDLPTSRSQYPFTQMTIGDSFDLKQGDDSSRRAVLRAAGHYRTKHVSDFRVITRRVRTKRKARVIRVWRIS